MNYNNQHVGGFNPSEKNMLVKLDHFSNFIGLTYKKYVKPPTRIE